MSIPEYLVMFSNNGTIDVRVKFEEDDISVAVSKMTPKEISALIAKNGKGFYQQMTFDEHTFAIDKYEIDPSNDRLTIFAKKIP